MTDTKDEKIEEKTDIPTDAVETPVAEEVATEADETPVVAEETTEAPVEADTEVVATPGTTEPVTPELAHPDFRQGDTIRVHYRIIEGDKTRTQPYEGIVIARKGSGNSKTFTVRRIGADSVGVERIFPLYGKNLEKLEVVKAGKVRRAKLYYLRDKVGKAAMKIKERKAK